MMEFLNNIWIAISTPNENLMKLLSIPLLFIESSLSFYLIVTTFNLKVKSKNKILYIVTTAVLSLIISILLPNPFNILFNYISVFIIIKITLKTNLLKTFVAAVLPTIVFTVVETLVFKPYITLLNITYDEILSTAIYKVPVTLFIYFIVFLITYIIKHKKFSLNFLDDIDKKSKSLITFNLLFGLIYIAIEIIITMQYIDTLPLTYTFANFIMLLLYFFISFYSISKVINLTMTTKKLESAEEYNKTLRILHDNVRGFKHDFDNIVTTIGGYINTDDMEGLKKYYVQLQQDCEKVNNLYILNPNSINNPRYI